MTTPDIESGRDPMTNGLGTTQEQIRDLKHQVVGQTRQALREARNRAGSSLSESKERLADQVGGLAGALRRTTDHLRGEDRTMVANLTDAVAGQADRAANYLRRVDARIVRQDLEGLVRRRPALALGGVLAIGLLAARFFKSSERRPAWSPPREREPGFPTPSPLSHPAGYPAQQGYGRSGDPYAGA